MPTKLLTYSTHLGSALKRGAHLSFMSAQAFVIVAIKEKLEKLGDPEVEAALAAHESQTKEEQHYV